MGWLQARWEGAQPAPALGRLPAPVGAEEVAGSTHTPKPTGSTGAPERLCSECRPKAQLSTKAFRGIT